MNDVAKYVEKLENIPIVEKEIGDTWIHGAGTDPKKLAHYRGVLRHISSHGVSDVDLTENHFVSTGTHMGNGFENIFP